MSGTFLYVFVFLFGLLSYIYLRRDKKEPQEKAKLPPGSMGWPFTGETLQLYSQDPNVFFAAKQKRLLLLVLFFFFFFFPFEITFCPLLF